MELIHGGDWAGQKERLGNRSIRDFSANVSPLAVSYTHLTLPTN